MCLPPAMALTRPASFPGSFLRPLQSRPDQRGGVCPGASSSTQSSEAEGSHIPQGLALALLWAPRGQVLWAALPGSCFLSPGSGWEGTGAGPVCGPTGVDRAARAAVPGSSREPRALCRWGSLSPSALSLHEAGKAPLSSPDAPSL